jgi:hypothetical protein
MRIASLFFGSLLVLACSGSGGGDTSSNGDTGLVTDDTGNAVDSTKSDTGTTTDSGTAADGEAGSDAETSGDTTTSGDSGPIDPTCHALSVAECAAWHRCVPLGFHAAFADDETLCTSVIDERDCEGAIDLPRTADYATARKACIDALGTADACRDFLRQLQTGPCDIHGTGTAGESCLDGSQCASRSCGYASAPPAPPPACGACDPVSPIGGPCMSFIRCEDGAGCFMSGSSGTCVALAEEGASCTSAPCFADDTCKGGTCVPRGDVGASCTSNADCLFGEACATTTVHTCQSSVGVAKAGEPCGNISGVIHIYCTPPLRCIFDSKAFRDTCSDALKAGDACNDNNGNPCEGTLRCVSGKCATPDTCAGDAGP